MKKGDFKVVISASRRTDIPAYYMPWFVKRLKAGWFEVVNPYNKKSRSVPADPDRVHAIVFWSKNFGPFIHKNYPAIFKEMGYRLFFNFTINSECLPLEPVVPPLADRLAQLEALCDLFDPEVVSWRFDPLCFYTTGNGRVNDNLMDFETIARGAAAAGVGRCITSFMDHYAKISRRTRSIPDFVFIDPPVEKKIETLYRMHAVLAPHGIELQTCCEKSLMDVLPADLPVKASACIPGSLLAKVYGAGLSLKRDTGQRVKAGCRCSVSVDVGSYDLHPCGHRCLYCYARPAGS